MIKVISCITPGVLEYRQLKTPVVTQGHALIRIRRIGICGTDLHAYEGTQPYFTYPRILGHELSGEVIECDDPGFRTGEKVTFIPYFSCGTCIACQRGKPNCCTQMQVFGVHIDGGMAEFVSVPVHALVRGEGLSLDALALVEPLAIGAHGVRRADVQEDEYVLVIGAGPIGLGTMEFARITGANVIALDINAARLRFCREKLGIAHTIDANAGNVKEHLESITLGNMPTVVIDATGNLSAINRGFAYLAHGGRYVLIGLQKGDIQFSHPEFHKREATLMSSRNATRQDFEHVVKSLQSGHIDPTTYITHRVLFDEVQSNFASWLDPANGVIKAMVDVHLD